MTYFYLDASAWVKRHVREQGTDWIGRLWLMSPSAACSTLGLIETVAAVARRHLTEDVPADVTRAALKNIREDFKGFH
jgi:predicted nucleic acid-binding protein